MREFKVEAVQLAQSSRKPLAQITRDLGSDDSIPHHWYELCSEQGEQAFPGSGHQTPQEEEMRHLKREIDLLRQGRDLLKKSYRHLFAQPTVKFQFMGEHSSEFTSDHYLAVLAELGIQVSMSRTANSDDNAAMESFFAALTKECTDCVRFESRQQARSAIFEYLECFYNPVRFHSTLQDVGPVAFEQANESKMS